MASAGGVGIDIDVARVPLREADMEPFEIMVSESQERMLAVVEPRSVDEVLAVCEKWQTGGAAIGEVTDSGRVRVLRDGEVVGEMPVEALVDELPALRPRARRARGLDLRQPSDARRRATPPGDAAGAARLPERRLEALGLRAVRLDRRLAHGAPARVGRRRGARRSPRPATRSRVSIDGNGRRVACDPYAGTVEAVLECAQNLACVGAEPLGLTNCLNFGNPEKPAVAWQLDRAVQGLADACEALGVPVVGGNVSLYNETAEGPIYPTPVVGMVGELPDAAPRAGGLRPREGDAIALVGPFAPSLAGSELAKLRGELGPRAARTRHRPRSPPPSAPSATRSARAARRRAHDISDGGLACALAELAIAGGVGCRVDLDPLIERAGRVRRDGRCSARGPAASCQRPGRGARAPGERGGVRSIDRRGRRRAIEIAAASWSRRSPSRDAERAWRSLG